jgi:hypothetical protein
MNQAPIIEGMSEWAAMVQKIENKETTLSFSSIKEFSKSPRHFMQYKLRKFEPTPAMQFGSMVHCLILEPDQFEERYYAIPKIDKRTKAGKLEYALAVDAAGSREIVDGKEMEQAKRIADDLRKNDASRWVLDHTGETEKAVEWNDYGYDWRGFIDMDSDHFSADLKIVADSNPKKFKWKIYDMMYHLQGTLYTIKGLKEKKPFFIVAVDRAANISVIEVSESVMSQALDQLDELMSHFKKCVALNEWWKSYDFYGPRSGIYQLSNL